VIDIKSVQPIVSNNKYESGLYVTTRNNQHRLTCRNQHIWVIFIWHS